MRYCKVINIVTFSFLTLSMISTSFSGAFTSTALAATSEVSAKNEKKFDNKSLLGGIAVIGVLSLLNHNNGEQTAVNLPAKIPEVVATSDVSTIFVGDTAQTQETVKNNGYSPDEKRAFELLNADRASNGLKPLKFNLQLATLGAKYADDMIKRKFFAHTDPDGKSPFDRMKQAGVNYSYAGENLAINTSIINAEKAFMNSPGHRSNILSPNYTDVGLGVRYDDKGSAYVVQEFIGK